MNNYHGKQRNQVNESGSLAIVNHDMFRELHPKKYHLIKRTRVFYLSSKIQRPAPEFSIFGEATTACVKIVFTIIRKSTVMAGQKYYMELYVKEQPPWIFNHVLDATQKQNSFSAIDQPMVICQCKVHHWSRKDVTIDNHRALDNGMHSKNC
jgi:hypothetical protein